MIILYISIKFDIIILRLVKSKDETKHHTITFLKRETIASWKMEIES